MREDFLHYIWKIQRYNFADLLTTDGKKLQIINPGHHNHDSGPDFAMAKIKIDDIEWCGSIEIHYLASDWVKHKHLKNAKYDNVILHVVWKNDVPAKDIYQKNIPTLELKERVDKNLIAQFDILLKEKSKIPCHNQFATISSMAKTSMLDRVMTERLELKSEAIRQLLKTNGTNWEEATYKLLASNFGFKINQIPMQQLGEQLDLKTIQKLAPNLFQVEALLLGNAGFLNDYFEEEYPRKLKQEYDYLTKKFAITTTTLTATQWKFSRMRPPNFPTIRLAQLATVLNTHSKLFSKLLEATTFEEISNIFDISVSEYWHTHYTFGNISKAKTKHIGKSTIDNIIINTVVPLLVCYAKEKQQPEYLDKAVQYLESIAAESNNITKIWDNIGYESTHAYDSQSLIALYNNYCSQKKCLNCTIGNEILKSSSSTIN